MEADRVRGKTWIFNLEDVVFEVPIRCIMKKVGGVLEKNKSIVQVMGLSEETYLQVVCL